MRWFRPIYFIPENRRERPRPRGGRKAKRQGMTRCWTFLQGICMANPKSLKDKAWGKCLICRQAGHWAKECRNHDKSPKMVCYKWHQLGHWAALCPQDPEPQGQVPSLPSQWLTTTEVVHSSQPTCHDNHHGAGVKGATGCGRWVQEFLGWHSRYLLCLDLLLWSLLLPNLYHLGCYRKNSY